MDEGFEAIMQYSVKGHDGFGGRKMSTVQNVFDIAIRLMDSQNETTGATDTSDTKEYKVRTCSLLNSILVRRAIPTRPVPPVSARFARRFPSLPMN